MDEFTSAPEGKSKAKYIVALVVLAALAAGAYFYFTAQSAKPQEVPALQLKEEPAPNTIGGYLSKDYVGKKTSLDEKCEQTTITSSKKFIAFDEADKAKHKEYIKKLPENDIPSVTLKYIAPTLTNATYEVEKTINKGTCVKSPIVQIKDGKEYTLAEGGKITDKDIIIERGAVIKNDAVSNEGNDNMHYLYSERDITFDDVFKMVDLETAKPAGTEKFMMIAVYDTDKGYFRMSENDVYATATKGQKIAENVEVADLGATKIKAGQTIILMSNMTELTLKGGIHAADEKVPDEESLCDRDKTGWYAVAANTPFNLVDNCLDTVTAIYEMTSTAPITYKAIIENGVTEANVNDFFNHKSTYAPHWFYFKDKAPSKGDASNLSKPEANEEGDREEGEGEGGADGAEAGGDTTGDALADNPLLVLSSSDNTSITLYWYKPDNIAALYRYDLFINDKKLTPDPINTNAENPETKLKNINNLFIESTPNTVPVAYITLTTDGENKDLEINTKYKIEIKAYDLSGDEIQNLSMSVSDVMLTAGAAADGAGGDGSVQVVGGQAAAESPAEGEVADPVAPAEGAAAPADTDTVTVTLTPTADGFSLIIPKQSIENLAEYIILIAPKGSTYIGGKYTTTLDGSAIQITNADLSTGTKFAENTPYIFTVTAVDQDMEPLKGFGNFSATYITPTNQ